MPQKGSDILVTTWIYMRGLTVNYIIHLIIIYEIILFISLILFIITPKFMFQFYIKMMVAFKNLKDDEHLNNEEI